MGDTIVSSMNFNKLNDIIQNERVITREATELMLELDIMPSVTTQALLNTYIVDLYHRLQKDNDVIIEVIDSEHVTDSDKFATWVRDNFTTYSYRMFCNTR